MPLIDLYTRCINRLFPGKNLYVELFASDLPNFYFNISGFLVFYHNCLLGIGPAKLDYLSLIMDLYLQRHIIREDPIIECVNKKLYEG